MADIKTLYGTADQTITITLASLGNTAYRGSVVIDNSSNLFIDAFVSGTIATGTSPSSTGTITVFAYGYTTSSSYTAGTTGTDADQTYTNNEQNQLIYLGTIQNTSNNNILYEFGPWSVASAWGQKLPYKWGIVVLNNSGAALNSTGGNHTIVYQGLAYQSV